MKLLEKLYSFIIANYLHTVIVMILVLYISGCSSTPSVRLSKMPPPRGKSVVFGSFLMNERSSVLSYFALIASNDSYLNFIDVSNSTILSPYKIKNSGDYFYLELPPGEYAIIGFSELGGAYTTTMTKRPFYASFVVLNANSIVYIGELNLLTKDETYSTRIDDEYDQAIKQIKETYPDTSDPITKNIMVLEDR